MIKSRAAVRFGSILGVVALVGGLGIVDAAPQGAIGHLFHPPQMSLQDKDQPQCDPEVGNGCDRTNPAAIRFAKYHPLKETKERFIEGVEEIGGWGAAFGLTIAGPALMEASL